MGYFFTLSINTTLNKDDKRQQSVGHTESAGCLLQYPEPSWDTATPQKKLFTKAHKSELN